MSCGSGPRGPPPPSRGGNPATPVVPMTRGGPPPPMARGPPAPTRGTEIPSEPLIPMARGGPPPAPMVRGGTPSRVEPVPIVPMARGGPPPAPVRGVQPPAPVSALPPTNRPFPGLEKKLHPAGTTKNEASSSGIPSNPTPVPASVPMVRGGPPAPPTRAPVVETPAPVVPMARGGPPPAPIRGVQPPAPVSALPPTNRPFPGFEKKLNPVGANKSEASSSPDTTYTVTTPPPPQPSINRGPPAPPVHTPLPKQIPPHHPQPRGGRVDPGQKMLDPKQVDTFMTPKLLEINNQFAEILGCPIPIEIDYSDWLNTLNFFQTSHGSTETMGHIVERLLTVAHEVFVEAGSSTSFTTIVASSYAFKTTISKKIKKIIIRYDPIDSLSAEHFRFEWADNQLHLILNLPQWNQSRPTGAKIRPLLQSLTLINANDHVIKTMCAQVFQCVGNPNFSIYIDWGSFLNSKEWSEFENKEDAIPYLLKSGGKLASTSWKRYTNDSVLYALYVALRRAMLHPLSATQIKARLNRFVVTHAESGQSFDFNDSGDFVARLNVRADMAKRIDTIQIQRLFESKLGTLMPSYLELAHKRIAISNQKSPQSKLIVDWAFLDETRYHDLGPDESIHELKLLCDVVDSVAQNILLFTKHTIRATCAENNIKEVHIKFTLSNQPELQPDCVLTSEPGKLFVALPHLVTSLNINLCEHLRFFYETLVPEAVYDARVVKEGLEGELKSNGLNIPIEIDLGFTKTKEFKALPYQDQYDVVYGISTQLSGRVVSCTTHHLRHPSGIPRKSFMDVKSLRLSLSAGSFSGTRFVLSKGPRQTRLPIREEIDEDDPFRESVETTQSTLKQGLAPAAIQSIKGVTENPTQGSPPPPTPMARGAPLPPIARGGPPPPMDRGGQAMFRGGPPPPMARAGPPPPGSNDSQEMKRGGPLPPTGAAPKVQVRGKVDAGAESLAAAGWDHINNNLHGVGKKIFRSYDSDEVSEVGVANLDQSKALNISCPINQLFQASASDWKDRLLDVFSLVLSLARNETETEFNIVQKEINDYFGCNVPIKVNWEEIDRHPKFQQKSPAERTGTFKLLNTAFIRKRLLGNEALTGQLGAACFSEARKKMLENFTEIQFKVDPSDAVARGHKIENKGLVFATPISFVRQAVGCYAELDKTFNFRSLIEDTVFEESKIHVNQDCASLKTSNGTAYPVRVDWESLRNYPSFKSVIPQTEYIPIIRQVRHVPSKILISDTLSVLKLFKETPPLEAAFKAGVQDIVIQITNGSKLLTPQLNNSTLSILVPFDNINCSDFSEFKSKMLDIFDLIVQTAQNETMKDFNSTQNSLNSSISLPIKLDLAWTKTPQFLKYTAEERYHMVRRYHKELPSTLLLGDAGFTGTFGLCEFNQTTQELKNKIQYISIYVSSSDAPLTVQNGDCKFTFGLEFMNKGVFHGCHVEVEKVLRLRPIKEAAVKKEVDQTIANYCKAVPINVGIDWSSVRLGDRSYVNDAREAGKVAQGIVIDTSSSDWSGYSIPKICQSSSSVSSALKQFQSLIVSFKEVTNNPGKSKKLLPHHYKFSKKDTSLILETSQKVVTPGPGLILEWFLCPNEAASREKSEVEKRANEALRAELARRDRAVQDAISSNQREKDNYIRDVESWKRECQQVQKDNEKPCPFCRGKLTVACGDGSKSCSQCKGSKVKNCTCYRDHPGKANRPRKPPSQPREPRMSDIPSFSSITIQHFINDF